MKISHCEFPDDLLYDVERGLWAKPNGAFIRVGITTTLSWSLGSFAKVTVKEPGTEVEEGQVIGSLDGSRNFEVVRSPVAGRVAAANPRLSTEPELLNRDPYGDGWLADIQLRGPEGISKLVSLPAAATAIEKKIEERHVRCFAAFPDYEMYSVGTECSSVLVKLGDLLANSPSRSVVHIVSDDVTAEAEMGRWSEATGNPVVDFRNEGGFFHFIVRKRD